MQLAIVIESGEFWVCDMDAPMEEQPAILNRLRSRELAELDVKLKRKSGPAWQVTEYCDADGRLMQISIGFNSRPIGWRGPAAPGRYRECWTGKTVAEAEREISEMTKWSVIKKIWSRW